MSPLNFVYSSQQSRKLTFTLLFLATTPILTPATAQTIGSNIDTNTTQTTKNATVPTLSTWDLFKNSQLQPCVLNTTKQPVQHVAKRSARHHSSSGGSGGSSTSSSSSSSSSQPAETYATNVTHYSYGSSAMLLSSVIYESWTMKGSNAYCQYTNYSHMPVVIPTQVTDGAFVPLYPSLIIQAISLIPSFWGLEYSFNVWRTSGSLPGLFWPQLVFDSIRFLAWYARVLEGWIDQFKFGWPNVGLWVLSFCYFFVFHALRRAREAAVLADQGVAMSGIGADTSYRAVGDDPEVPRPEGMAEAHLHAEGADPDGLPPKYSTEDSHPLILGEPPRETPDDGSPLPAYRRRAGPLARLAEKLPLRPFTLAFFVSTLLMWIFTVTVNIMHRLPFSYAHPFTQAMLPLPSVSQDPAGLAANMPDACVSFLATNATFLASNGLYEQAGDRGVAAIFENGQTILFTLLCLRGVVSAVKFRNDGNGEALRASQVLGACRYIVTLILPLVVMANTVYLAVTVFGQRAAVNYTFTSMSSAWGVPCTFVAVGMDKRFGYLDVAQGLGMRIGQSVLGIA